VGGAASPCLRKVSLGVDSTTDGFDSIPGAVDPGLLICRCYDQI
jgi:hypothetical protein